MVSKPSLNKITIEGKIMSWELDCEKCGKKINRKNPLIPLCLECIKKYYPELLYEPDKIKNLMERKIK